MPLIPNDPNPAPQQGQQDNGLTARLGAKVRKWKDAATFAQKERDDLKAKLDGLEKEAADLRGRADGNEAARQRDELAMQLRTLKHRAEFDRAAKAAGATTPKQIEDLWQLSGYKPEADEPDPAAIQATIAAQKAERAYLFGQGNGRQDQLQPADRPGPGKGRGESDRENQGIFEITRAQASDPQFMRANSQKIWQASQEGRFSIAEAIVTR